MILREQTKEEWNQMVMVSTLVNGGLAVSSEVSDGSVSPSSS